MKGPEKKMNRRGSSDDNTDTGTSGDEAAHAEADKRRKRKKDDGEDAAAAAEGGYEEDEDNMIDSEMYYKIRKLYAEGLAKTLFKENVTEVGEKYILSERAKSAISDLALDFSRMLTVDAMSFARHAKRSRIAIDDVKLFCRRNPITKKALDDAIASFSSSTASTSGSSSPNGPKKASPMAVARKTSPGNITKKKEPKGSAMTVNSPPQQQPQQSLPASKSTKGQKAQKSSTPLSAVQIKQPTVSNESCYFGSKSKSSPNSFSKTTSSKTSNNGDNEDDDDFLFEGINFD